MKGVVALCNAGTGGAYDRLWCSGWVEEQLSSSASSQEKTITGLSETKTNHYPQGTCQFDRRELQQLAMNRERPSLEHTSSSIPTTSAICSGTQTKKTDHNSLSATITQSDLRMPASTSDCAAGIGDTS